MSRSERFAWITPWKIILGAVLLLAVMGMPTGLYYWKNLAVEELVRAVESDDSHSAIKAALGKVRERKATELAVQGLMEVLEKTAKKGPIPGFLMTAMKGLGAPAVFALSEVAKKHETLRVRTYAIFVLGWMEVTVHTPDRSFGVGWPSKWA